jgi:diaminopimelate epimerase
MAAMLPFTKVEGLGNDFVVVDLRGARATTPEATAVQDPETVRRVCDRHFGVGADGILAVLPGTSGDARMRVLNADGSEAEMCGNGIRCVAKYLYEADPALRRPVLKIDTGAGLLACEMTAKDGRVDSVTVEMGRPRFTRDEIPVAPGGTARVTREPIVVPLAQGREFRFTAVSMGNPHAVIFIDDPAEDLMALATKYGPSLETSPTFPRRTNVEFARVRKDGEIDLVVWERGCGITLACGTGACGTAVAAAVEERLPRGKEIIVHLPGGPLGITVASDDSGVRMRGPAKTVFRSELEL